MIALNENSLDNQGFIYILQCSDWPSRGGATRSRSPEVCPQHHHQLCVWPRGEGRLNAVLIVYLYDSVTALIVTFIVSVHWRG